uniref:ORF67 n=1 Tax=Malaco herpesvirus 1 TaxID=3031797 RepID=A0AA48P7S9_9VIRU|nr:TPA_asm: ORF67 [Malaco herpesvirus 1]
MDETFFCAVCIETCYLYEQSYHPDEDLHFPCKHILCSVCYEKLPTNSCPSCRRQLPLKRVTLEQEESMQMYMNAIGEEMIDRNLFEDFDGEHVSPNEDIRHSISEEEMRAVVDTPWYDDDALPDIPDNTERNNVIEHEGVIMIQDGDLPIIPPLRRRRRPRTRGLSFTRRHARLLPNNSWIDYANQNNTRTRNRIAFRTLMDVGVLHRGLRFEYDHSTQLNIVRMRNRTRGVYDDAEAAGFINVACTIRFNLTQYPMNNDDYYLTMSKNINKIFLRSNRRGACGVCNAQLEPNHHHMSDCNCKSTVCNRCKILINNMTVPIHPNGCILNHNNM